jgi:hypothetical protein
VRTGPRPHGPTATQRPSPPNFMNCSLPLCPPTPAQPTPLPRLQPSLRRRDPSSSQARLRAGVSHECVHAGGVARDTDNGDKNGRVCGHRRTLRRSRAAWQRADLCCIMERMVRHTMREGARKWKGPRLGLVFFLFLRTDMNSSLLRMKLQQPDLRQRQSRALHTARGWAEAPDSGARAPTRSALAGLRAGGHTCRRCSSPRSGQAQRAARP